MVEWWIWAILADGDPRNNSVKLFQNQPSCLGGEALPILALVAIIFNGAKWFWALLLEGHPWNIPVKLFPNLSSLIEASCSPEWNDLSNFDRWTLKEHFGYIISNSIYPFRRSRLKLFFFFSIFSTGGHLVWQSRTVWAILEEGCLSKIPVKLFQNPSICLGGEVIKSFFVWF